MALVLGCKRNSNSAPAMMTPVPPRSQSPLTQLTTSPRTCVEMITTASLHPQRRRRNHPIPAVVRATPSTRKRIPTLRPRGASCLYAIGLRAQTRSRAVPRQSKVVAARLAMTAPKNKKMPIAVNPGVVGRIASKGWCDSSLHYEYSPSSNSFIGLLAPGTRPFTDSLCDRWFNASSQPAEEPCSAP